MKEFRKLFGLFLFISLMLVKVSALHVYTHNECDSEQIEECEICDVVFENQNNEHNFDNGFDLEVTENLFLVQESISINPHTFISSPIEFRFFGRPPPSLV